MLFEGFTNLSQAANLIRFPKIYAQRMETLEKSSKEGIFIGNTYSLPYFLDFDGLMNPHIFICGITGSGKTYLMRNLLVKLRSITESLIILIDFTGEYGEFVSLLGEKEAKSEDIMDSLRLRKTGILYINLRNKENEHAKIELADRILNSIIENMRVPRTTETRTFVFFDEAWKLLGASRALQTLLREGRKYKHGLVFSSQLAEDFDSAMISNAATLFMFRSQNKQGLNRIANNYNFSEEQVEIIQNLQVGSCIVSQTNSFSKKEFLWIKKVRGLELESFIAILLGNNMELEISKEKFERAMRNISDKETLMGLFHLEERRGTLELSKVVRILVAGGAESRKILNALRGLGIGDEQIADAFSAAVYAKSDDAYENYPK